MTNYEYMIKLLLPALLLIPTLANAQSENAEQLIAAAIELKKGHVERQWNDCMAKTDNETHCKNLLTFLWEQEKTVLLKLSQHMQNPLINSDVLAKQSMSCYDPTGDYDTLIKCWKRLDDRTKQALNGQTLIMKAR